MALLQTPAELLSLAINIASCAHLYDVDKGGAPYILHPIRLMMRLRTEDYELMQIAVLHDVFEDHPDKYTISQLSEMGFSERVCTALVLLTHISGSYDQYIEQLGHNMDCVLVKYEDLRDNSDITRLRGISEKDTARMIKYHKAFKYLSEVKNSYVNHNKY